MPENPTIPEIQDRRRRVPGVLPKNAQAWVVIGIAVLMVFSIALSSRNGNPKSHAPAANPAPAPVETRARIQEYRAQIEAEARRLSAEQAQLVAAKQALGVSAGSAPGGAGPLTPMPRHSRSNRGRSRYP